MPDHSPIRLCVYCGSNTGTSPAFAATAARLGTSLANRGIGLVFGGGRVGLMGLAADAALQAGGEVIGVITEQLVHIGPAVGGQVANTLADDTAGKVDDVGGSSKIGCGKIGAHGPEVTER